MGLQRFPIRFGGLNLADSPFDLAPPEAQAALNVTLSLRGALSQRAGKIRFDSANPLAAIARHARQWAATSTSRHLFVSLDNGDVLRIPVGGAVPGAVSIDGTAGTVWAMEQAQDGAGSNRLWLLNGTDTPRIIAPDGTVSNWTTDPGGLAVPNGTMLRNWKNRMCIAGVAATPQRLFFSDIGNPRKPDAAAFGTNWVDIKQTEDDLDPITWLEVLGDFLIVFKKHSVWIVYDPTTFANRRIGDVGCEDRFQSCVSAGFCFFLNRAGVYRTNGSRVYYESRPLEPFFRTSVAMGSIGKARLFASPDSQRVFVAISTAGAENNRLLEYAPTLNIEDTDEPPWMIHDLPVSAACRFRPISNDVLIGADSSVAELHTLFEGANDDGVAIRSYWKSGWKSLIAEEPFERIRRVNLEMSGKLVLDVFRDFSQAAAYSKVLEAPSPTDAEWDGGTWDGGTWNPEIPVALRRARPESRGRYHAIQLRNEELNKTFSVYAAEYALRGGKEH